MERLRNNRSKTPIRLTDALGRAMVLSRPARRIVSLVPSISEVVVQLLADAEGQQHDQALVGCTTFCVRPEALRRQATVVGGTKRFHADRIDALEPDLVLANREENERAAVLDLAQRHPVYVSAVADLDDNRQLVEALGRMSGREPQAGRLIRETDAGFDAWRRKRPQFLRAPRVAYAIWREPWMFAGGGTYIDAMLREAGWANALGDRERYPASTLEELRTLQPDLVLLSSEPFPFKETHREELAAALDGVLPLKRIAFADGEAFSWYGYRPLEAPAEFFRLHRELGTLDFAAGGET